MVFSVSVLLVCGLVFMLLILCLSGVEWLLFGQIVGVVMVVSGVLLFIVDKLLVVDWQVSLGDLMLLVVVVLFSYYMVVVKLLIQYYGGVIVLGYGSLVCILFMLLWCVLSLVLFDLCVLFVWVWMGMVWQVVGGGFIGWLVWGWVNEWCGVVCIVLLIYLMFLVVGLVVWVWGGEQFSVYKLLGVGVIFVGVVFVQFSLGVVVVFCVCWLLLELLC